MYQYEHHFRSYYHNPTILETVSIATKWVNTGESFLLKYNDRE